jgi:hypothetical protein
MADLSATRKISSVSTNNGIYFVGHGAGYYDKVTTVEKSGSQAYIIWYQLWQGGQVTKEINSLHVIDVEYEFIPDGELPF